jgi:hypothetical protein
MVMVYYIPLLTYGKVNADTLPSTMRILPVEACHGNLNEFTDTLKPKPPAIKLKLYLSISRGEAFLPN